MNISEILDLVKMALNFGQDLFRGSPQQTQQGFDAVDVTTRRSIVIFWGGVINDPDNLTYIMSAQKFYSSRVATVTLLSNDTQNTYETGASVTFTLTFDSSVNIDGLMIVNCPITLHYTSGAAEGHTCRLDIDVNHFDGSTTTELDAGVLDEIALRSPTSGNSSSTMATAKFNISRYFKKGESLTIDILAEFKKDGAVSVDRVVGIGHDPQNRARVAMDNSTVDFSDTNKESSDSIFSVQVPMKQEFN